jgi:hypothetical protein
MALDDGRSLTDEEVLAIATAPLCTDVRTFLCGRCSELHIVFLDEQKKPMGQCHVDRDWLVAFFVEGMSALGYSFTVGEIDFNLGMPPTDSKH